MAKAAEPEVWLRGPLPDIPPFLQPVAHSLLQCRVEVRATMNGLTPEQIWRRPANVASVGYHVRHAIGSLDRLFTYARGEQLSAVQLATLRSEGDASTGPNSAEELVAAFEVSVEAALLQLRATNDATLLDARGVGRAQLPSTVIGLLFHAAEHTQRHVGQLVTTAKVVP
jgi:DinB superfamily